MSTKTYAGYSTTATPQSEPIPGEDQIPNNAGGYAYALDPWKAFERFLILGSEGGTYYVKEQKLTRDNAVNSLACIQESPARALALIVSVSDEGRAPKNDAAEFALALVASSPNVETRKLAYAALPQVCRIPTHLFHFLTYVNANRGWSRGLRTAVANWYDRFDANQLAFELVKYQSRDGWANRDALRLAHPRLAAEKQAALRWATGVTLDAREVKRDRGARVDTYGAVGAVPDVIAAFEEAKTAKTARLLELIAQHNLTREMVPTEKLTEPVVWEALLDKMPPHALLRNLGNLSKCGLLKPLSAAEQTVLTKLTRADEKYLREKRIHPVAVLLALKAYGQGRGVKGAGEWTTVPSVVDALDAMFYRAFGAMVPTGRRLLFAVDVSGSMSMGSIAGVPLMPSEGAAAMALACAKSETRYHIMGFADRFRDLGITPRMRLDDVVTKTRGLSFGGTDCALPMIWARQNKVDVDAFVVITDNETWAGNSHPSQELRKYRQERGIAAKEIVMGMTATNISIADPLDPLTLDVAGFDANTPQAVTEFVRL